MAGAPKVLAKPKDMKTAKLKTVRQFFSLNPKKTTFLAKNRSSGWFRGKTSKLATQALKQVYGNQSAVNIAKLSFKQQAYKDALEAKEKKVADRLKASPFGVSTSIFSKPQFLIKRRQAKALAKINLLKEKVKSYNAKSQAAINKLSQTKLGQATLKPLVNSEGNPLKNPNGTLVKRTSLSNTMQQLKDAYNAKKTGAISSNKIRLSELIKEKQVLDDAVIKAKAESFADPGNKDKAKAYKAAVAAKDKYKKTSGPQEIKKLIKVLRKTNKISQIKFNNLYAVAKNTSRGKEIRAQAKRNVLTTTNSARQLKREAKYSSLKKISNLSFYQKYIKGKPLYTSVAGQTNLLAKVTEAEALKAKLLTEKRGPNSSETKILKRSMKAKAILRTLGRTTYSNSTGKTMTLLNNSIKLKLSNDIMKSPLKTKNNSIITQRSDQISKIETLDKTKLKASDSLDKFKANTATLLSLNDQKRTLVSEYGTLTDRKTELEVLIKKAEVDKADPDPLKRDEAQKTLATLTTEKAEIDSKIKINQTTSNDILVKTGQLEGENKEHKQNIETYKTLQEQYKDDAELKLKANEEKMANFNTEKIQLEASLSKAGVNTPEAIKIRERIMVIEAEQKKLVDDTKLHEEVKTKTLNTPPVVAPVAPIPVVAPPVVAPPVVTQPKIKKPLSEEEKNVALAAQQRLIDVYTKSGQTVPPSPEELKKVSTAAIKQHRVESSLPPDELKALQEFRAQKEQASSLVPPIQPIQPITSPAQPITSPAPLTPAEAPRPLEIIPKPLERKDTVRTKPQNTLQVPISEI